MVYKRGSKTVFSDRYGPGRFINPFDRKAFVAAKQFGRQFYENKVLERADRRIKDVKTILNMTKIFGQDLIAMCLPRNALAMIHPGG
jgi:hypothetical protein